MKNNVVHSDRAHAKLSPSSSHRWLNCSASVKAEKGYKNTTSIHAQIGTSAHELAEKCLVEGKDASEYIGREFEGHTVDDEMALYVQEYVDYVHALETSTSKTYIETRVDLTKYIPNGFGSLDAAVYDAGSSTLHIIDLKYGIGVQVDAEHNTQLSIYALGMYEQFWDNFEDVDHIVLHVIQPRKYNYSTWKLAANELLEFGQEVIIKAKKALSDDAEFTPSEKACQWCKHKPNCKALYEFTKDLLINDFDDLSLDKTSNMDDIEKRNILDNKSLIQGFIKSVEQSVFDQIESGQDFVGYKLVEGRSIRKWTNDAEEVLKTNLGDDAYEQKLIGITSATKLMGKKEIDELTYKPKGKNVLAQESDKRKSIESVTSEFDVV